MAYIRKPHPKSYETKLIKTSNKHSLKPQKVSTKLKTKTAKLK